jgi:hypothetical protein
MIPFEMGVFNITIFLSLIVLDSIRSLAYPFKKNVVRINSLKEMSASQFKFNVKREGSIILFELYCEIFYF